MDLVARLCAATMLNLAVYRFVEPLGEIYWKTCDWGILSDEGNFQLMFQIVLVHPAIIRSRF